MTYRFILKAGIYFAATFVLLLLPQATEAQDGPPNLFQYATVEIEGERVAADGLLLLDSRSQDQYDLYQQAATTEQVALVYMDLAALRLAESVTLNLELQQEPTSDLLNSIRIEDRAPDDYSWFGAVSALTDNNTTSAIMVVTGTQVVGTIRRGSDLYQVRPLNNGAHVLIHVDRSNIPADHPPGFDDEFRRDDDASSGLGDQPTGSTQHFVHPTDGGELDCRDFTVLVAYTPAAKAEAAVQGGIDALIQLAIDETNEGYRNSYINIQVPVGAQA